MPPSTVSNTDYIVAFTEGNVYAGVLNQTLTQIGEEGTGLAGPFIETFTSLDSDGVSKVFAVDGAAARVVDPLNDIVRNWRTEVLSRGRGALPENCALAAIYRGRAVLARQPTNGRIWFMSRIANPMDWDFGADPINTAAVAGVNAEVGQPGDSIRSLMPFGDDYLFFGCSNTLWAMIGDPGFGGQIQNVSRKTGVLSARAYTFDDEGILWFLGNSGLHVIREPTARPENVSDQRLVTILDRVDVDNTLVQLAFDGFKKSVHIFLTPFDGSTVGTHVVFEKPSASFWFDEYPLDFGPWSVVDLSGATDDDRRFIIGGDDGMLRRPRDDRFDDDGQVIRSFVDFGPFEDSEGLLEVMAQELNAYFYAGSGETTWRWFTADSPDEVRQLDDGSERRSGTFGIVPT
jgi:hypothetical protein